MKGYLSSGGRERNKIWHKSSLRDEDDAQTSNTRIVQRMHAIPYSTTKDILNDEDYDIRYTRQRQIERLI